ncbi:MAG: TlpA family protein disulfide reductase [Acidobacteria bacterium]|nr:TlpA family protein disulfide reductase [Acidobacteriota bacterium]
MIVQPETNTRASRAKFAATNLLLITSAMLALCVVAAAQESTVTLAGQVVCSDCWSEAKDRVKTPYGNAADLVCAATCAAKGRPASLAVKTGEGNQFALYQLEEGRFKTGAKDWLALMGKQVEATGTMRGEGGKRRLTVDELRVVSDSPAALEAAKMIGTQAELALRDLSGAEQRLSALRGRVVVLNFWATYCAPCRKEMPDLAAIQNDYAAQGVQVVGASSDEAEDRAKVLQFIKETKINFPVWLGATAEMMPRFGLVPVLPGTVVIDREGRIVSASNAVVNPAALRKQLDALLAADEKKAAAQGGGAKEEAGEASTVPS